MSAYQEPTCQDVRNASSKRLYGLILSLLLDLPEIVSSDICLHQNCIMGVKCIQSTSSGNPALQPRDSRSIRLPKSAGICQRMAAIHQLLHD